MRKPLFALSLAFTAALGATPAAGALAAIPNSNLSLNSVPPTTTKNSPNSRTNAVSGAQIVQTALQYLGYPYTTTGNSPQTGFSCIGFVSFVYRSNGINLPGDLGNAIAYAPQVPFNQLQPGDILYFQNTVWSGLSHAAIYLGGGRFVHAEWYNRGVVISSFNNDKVDGNYWIGHYLGANRPWAGAALSAVIAPPPAPPTTGANGGTGVTTTAVKQILNGPTALVTVPSLNVRLGPSKHTAVAKIIPQGTNLVLLGKTRNWYKVQLPDGTIGWVVAQGIGLSGATAQAQQQAANPTVGTTGANGLNGATPAVGTASTPQQHRFVSNAVHHRTTTIKVSGLRVHSSPSLSAPVVTTVSQGQRMHVLGQSNGWLKVLTPSGAIGWIVASFTSSSHVSAATLPAKHAFRVRVNSSRPRLTNRTWSSARGPVLTSGVRVHAAPGLRARVIGLVAAGTHVRILSRAGAWSLVRLPSGLSGYVYSSFIR